MSHTDTEALMGDLGDLLAALRLRQGDALGKTPQEVLQMCTDRAGTFVEELQRANAALIEVEAECGRNAPTDLSRGILSITYPVVPRSA